MDEFKQSIDEHIMYDSFLPGDIAYDNKYGELVFNKGKRDTLILQSIYIVPEYRNQGLCKEILQYIIDKCDKKFKYFMIQSVISNILYDYLLRFTYKNKQFMRTEDGFIYTIKN